MKKEKLLKTNYNTLLQYNHAIADQETIEKAGEFFLRYFLAEALYKKLLIAERKDKTAKEMSKRGKKNLRIYLPDIKRVLLYFNIQYDEALIERVFGSNDKNYTECSIRKLRDRAAHSINENVIRVIAERYEDSIRDINAVVSLFCTK